MAARTSPFRFWSQLSELDLQFGGRRNTPLIRQAETSECGLACLAMVAGYHGLVIDLVSLRRHYQTSLKGVTLAQLLGIAESLGLSGRPMRAEIHELTELTLPAILHWDLNHFVVLTRISRSVRGKQFHLHDPAEGILNVGEAEMRQRFTGVVLELLPATGFQPQILRSKLRIRQLWSRIDGLASSFWQIIALSVVLQLCALAAPFFLQVGIDSVLPTADRDLLLLLALGFGGVAAISLLANWARALVLVRLGTALSYQVIVNLFRHLVRLPLPWFERRHVGDIISRFSSARSIMDLVSQSMIAVVVDGVMATATLVLVFVYAPILGALASSSVALLLALRLGFFSALKRANVSLITANARENSVFIETLRGIATIKASGEEGNRQRLWQQRKAEATNAEIKTGQLNAGFSAGEQFLMAAERVVFIYLAIRFAIAGTMSIGMIFALQSYRQQFLDAANRLIQQAISYRLLDMHLARVADIAFSSIEAPITPPGGPGIPAIISVPRIELRGVRFRYAPNEPEVLQGVNLVIEPTEVVGLIGPSGGGKSTLVKILMGLLTPTAGEVLIDGVPMPAFGIDRWRRTIASVTQEDTLFAGSLADNISMFDADPSDARIESAARAAGIHDEICKMPMRYLTPVGDMGSVLSGGQRQRVMLARALYRDGKILFLDEATAHLDPSNESAIIGMLSRLHCSRVVVAHRPEAIRVANKVYLVDAGRVMQLSKIEEPASSSS